MANAGYFPGPERRRQILAGAKKVFAARGYHETNISHICDDLGIARGTLYQYFDSKKAVFAAIVEDLLERVREAVREAVGLDVEIDAILRAIDDITVDRLAKDISMGKRAGIFREDVDPRSAALFVIGGIQKLALAALSQNGSIDIDAIAREAAELQMSGLLSRKVKR